MNKKLWTKFTIVGIARMRQDDFSFIKGNGHFSLKVPV